MADTIINEPQITLNIIKAGGAQGVNPQKVLFVGQQNGGTSTAGTLTENVLDEGDINTRFGENSQLAQSLRAFREINEVTQVDVISLADDGGATAATAIATITGPATSDGTLILYSASRKNRAYSLDVLSGDTDLDIADALEAAINADTEAPFTAAAAGAILTLTAVNGGTVANDFMIAYDHDVTGVTVTLTAWTGGATDPVVTDIFDVVGTERYQTIVYPYQYGPDEVVDFLNERFNVSNNILDGMAVMLIADTLANCQTAAEALDSQSAILIAENLIDGPVADGALFNDTKGGSLREIYSVITAQVAAIRSLRLTDGANLANVVVTTSGVADIEGGISLATLPYFNSPIGALDPPPVGTWWTDLGVTSLNNSGCSTVGPNRNRSGVILGEMLTTYTTDGSGSPDTSFKFVNTVDASSVGREYQYNNMKVQWVQSRLTDGDLIANRSIENEDSIRAYCLTLYRDLADLAIYQAGEAAVEDFTSTLNVEVDLTAGDGSVTINEAPLLVGQLRTVFGTIQINFGD